MRSENISLHSYGRLQVVNATHAYWEQRSVEQKTVLDSLWIVQHRHGKFLLDSLPEDVSQEIGEDLITHTILPGKVAWD